MKTVYSLIVLAFMIVLSSCESNTNKKTQESFDSIFDYSGVIEQVIQTSKYTYCYLKDDKNEHWIAITKADVHAGETLYFNKGMEMIDFHSKELDRTFPSVFFVQNASTNPMGDFNHPSMPEGDEPVKPKIEKKDYSIQKASDGITIAELYKNKEKYKGQKVKIRGKITKFTPAILGKNWIHLQDGTEFEGNFDLTITTDEIVNTDATVTFEGTVELDKDFGYGYYYPVLLQNAQILLDN